MNKNTDFLNYSLLGRQFGHNQRSQKVIHTRILKLSTTQGLSLYETIGTELFLSRKLQKSLIPLKRAIIIYPHSISAQITYAKALFHLQKENEAFLSIKNALSLSPTSSQLHLFVIDSLKGRSRLKELTSFYQEVANIMTDKQSIAELFFYSAENLTRHDKYPQALENYKKAIEANPTCSSYYYEYGMAFYHEGLFEEALIQFEHLQKLDPNNKNCYHNIAHFNYLLGRVEKALEGFEYIIENGLENYCTYANVIMVLCHLDQDDEVINPYKDLLQPALQSNRSMLRHIFNEELRLSRSILEKSNINEEIREFNTKRLKGVNLVLSIIN